jgi:hypothetical protein
LSRDAVTGLNVADLRAATLNKGIKSTFPEGNASIIYGYDNYETSAVA